jgi:hypothetical protein
MRRALLLATVIGLATSPAAHAATLGVSPTKSCYRSGEKPALAGSGFTPNGSVAIFTNGTSIGTLTANNLGVFFGSLTVGQARGEKLRTYTAIDQANPALTAGVNLRVSALAVAVKPKTGKPTRRVRITARGFTTGKRLYAHVRRGKHYRRNVKIGTLKKSCHKLSKKRRIFRSNAPSGSYLVQFDTKRKYSKKTAVRVRFNVTVFRTLKSSAAVAENWVRLP